MDYLAGEVSVDLAGKGDKYDQGKSNDGVLHCGRLFLLVGFQVILILNAAGCGSVDQCYLHHGPAEYFIRAVFHNQLGCRVAPQASSLGCAAAMGTHQRWQQGAILAYCSLMYACNACNK